MRRKDRNKINYVSIEEGTNHIEIWISTKYLDSIGESSYLLDIDKKSFIKDNKIVVTTEPFIYSSNNPSNNNSIPSSELELINKILNEYINVSFFNKIKLLKNMRINGIRFYFEYANEYIDYLKTVI